MTQFHNGCTGSAQWGNNLQCFKSIQCQVHYSSNNDITEKVELLIKKLNVGYTHVIVQYSCPKERNIYLVNANQYR